MCFRRSKTDPKRCVLTYSEPGITYMKTINVPLSWLEELVAESALVEMVERMAS